MADRAAWAVFYLPVAGPESPFRGLAVPSPHRALPRLSLVAGRLGQAAAFFAPPMEDAERQWKMRSTSSCPSAREPVLARRQR